LPAFDVLGAADNLREPGAPRVTLGRHELARAVLFQTDRSEAKLYRLAPADVIPAHTHSYIDDIFVPVSGRGLIREWAADGSVHDHLVGPGEIYLIEPETPHEVSCAAAEFCFVLIQSPRGRYDFRLREPDAAD
jgi:quercetin dioxygenase-like cupin family protein